MCLCFGTAVSFCILELSWGSLLQGADAASPHWNIQSQKPKGEGGRQNPKFMCNIKQKNQRRGWFVLLTKSSKICLKVCVSVFLNQRVLQKEGGYSRSRWGRGVWVTCEGHSLCWWCCSSTWEVAPSAQGLGCDSCAASGTGEPDFSKKRLHGESWTADNGEGFSWGAVDAPSTKPHQPCFLLVPTALLSHNFPPGYHLRAEAAEVHTVCPGKWKCRKWNKDRSYPKAIPRRLAPIADQNGAQVKNGEADSRGRVWVQTETGQYLRWELLSVQGVMKGSLSEQTALVLLQWSLCMGSPQWSTAQSSWKRTHTCESLSLRVLLLTKSAQVWCRNLFWKILTFSSSAVALFSKYDATLIHKIMSSL